MRSIFEIPSFKKVVKTQDDVVTGSMMFMYIFVIVSYS